VTTEAVTVQTATARLPVCAPGQPVQVTGTLTWNKTLGARVRLRLENLAAECPGTFEGTGAITATTLTATYHGMDCEVAVRDGRLDLTLRAANR
jgi:hypothetical protein